MLRSLGILLVCPALAAASCGTHRLQYYDLLIRENRYPEALRLVLTDLDATPAEKRAFKIVAVGDDEQALSISPSVLQASKSAACQQAVGVLVRARDHRKDREQLKAYHQDWIASRKGWTGCDIAGKKLDQPEEAAAIAYECLENPALEAHQASTELRVLLAKANAGDVRRLTDEDADLLQQQLNLFHDGSTVFDDKSTDSYYIPQIKHADRKTFCQAVRYAQVTLRLKSAELSNWQQACRQLEPAKK